MGVHSGSGSGSYSVVATSWQSPTDGVKSYNFGANNTVAPAKLTALSGTTLQFFWTAGNNSKAKTFGVSQELSRSDGLEMAVPSTQVSYLVHSPSGIKIAALYQPTQVGPYNSAQSALSSGTVLIPPTSVGINLQFKATAPADGTGYSGGGDFAASQVITSSIPSIGTGTYADGCALFTTDYSGGTVNDDPGRNLFVAGGDSINPYSAIDAPAYFPLPNPTATPATAGDSFTDYFIYRPSGTNSIWVTLGALTWVWQGTVTNNNGSYVLSNAIDSSTDANGSTSTTEPTWTSIFGSVTDCHPLPTH